MCYLTSTCFFIGSMVFLKWWTYIILIWYLNALFWLNPRQDVYPNWNCEILSFLAISITILLAICWSGRNSCELNRFWSAIDVKYFHFSVGWIFISCYFVSIILASNCEILFNMNWLTLFWKLKGINFLRNYCFWPNYPPL